MSDFFSSLSDPDKAQQYLIQQGSDAWDDIRRGRFTSSEIHNLMSPGYRLMTPEELKNRPKKGEGSGVKWIESPDILSDAAKTYIQIKVAEVLTGTTKENSYAFPMVRGTEMEPEAVEYFEKQTGLVCEEVGFVPFGDHAGGSPDRYIGDEDLLEVKCPWTLEKQIDYLELTDQWDLKRYSAEYYWQCMSNLFFTTRQRCHFITYDPRYPEPYRMTHIIIKPEAQAFDLIAKKITAAVKEKLEKLKYIEECLQVKKSPATTATE
jgi:hypothetical protein